jgi:cell division inhibitor SulA
MSALLATPTTPFEHPEVWRASQGAALSLRTVATGRQPLDAALPGHGWPLARLTEILLPQPGIGEVELLLPLLARRSRAGSLLVWIRPPCPPNLPLLAAFDVDLSRTWMIRTRSEQQGLWAAEQILGSGVPVSVLLWAETADERSLRRLSLAAEGGDTLAILFRPRSQVDAVSPAALRIRMDGPSDRHPLYLVKARGLACSATQPQVVRLREPLRAGSAQRCARFAGCAPHPSPADPLLPARGEKAFVSRASLAGRGCAAGSG